MSDTSENITKKSGSNLALSFSFLSPEKRHAMSVFYAFCRIVDDIADSQELAVPEKERLLNEWSKQIRLCYTGTPETAIARELAEVVKQYLIPPHYLEEIVEGVAMDLRNTLYDTWDDLRHYCYRVASCVGLVSIEIFGYNKASTRQYAELLGLAFQTTNIVRDVKADWEMGRIYLPLEDMKKVGYSREELQRGLFDDRAKQVCRMMAERSEHYYGAAERMLDQEDRQQMLAAQIMRKIYYAVLKKIKSNDCDVWNANNRTSKISKLLLMQQCKREEKRAPTLRRSQKIVVIGGGLAGLSAAWHLSRAGHQVTLLEARQTLGGRTTSFTDTKTGMEIDNGQHVLMGCYRESLRFIKELGTVSLLNNPNRLDVPYASVAKGFSRLRASCLPAPLHLLQGLAGFKELSWADKCKICEVGISAKLDASGKKWIASTAAEWLTACRQSQGTIRAMWEPLCLAALNEPLQTSAASLLGEVIRRAFWGTAQESALLIPKTTLTKLFIKPASDMIEASNGRIIKGCSVKRFIFEKDRISGLICARGQSEEKIEADAIVSAIPWGALRPMLPPSSRLAGQTAQLRGSPIVGIYLWLDRHVTDEKFIGFLDSPIQWMFNADAIAGNTAAPSFLHSFIVSAAGSLPEKSSSKWAQLAMDECCRLIPSSRSAKVLHHFVYWAEEATLQSSPEIQPLRPTPETEWKQFYLAGDWTDTKLPSTIEGAILSGRLAAEQLL